MVESCASVGFDFYGLGVELRSQDPKTVEGIGRDFAYFRAEPREPDVLIEVADRSPDFASLPDLKASIHTINYVCYSDRDRVYTDYHGKGLRVSDLRGSTHHIASEDPDLRHEISYLTILSAVGRFLDSKRIHRVHALGISANGKAVLILLPEKGGKTTLALRLLESGRVKLLSEDSPLIARDGTVLPFPLRLGILPGGESDIPAAYQYPVSFMRVGTKILVDVEYYADKIGSACRPGAILLGQRVLGCGAGIEPARRVGAAREFVKNSVIGMGLHQGLEYLLGRSLWDTLGRSRLALSRLGNSVKVLRHSKVYRYRIGHDTERNYRVLMDFIDSMGQ